VASIEKRQRNGKTSYRVRYSDPAGRARFGEWAERWWRTTAALRPTTRHDYRALLDNQVLPAFAGARLARNVAAGVKLPKVQRREMGFLDAVQVEQLADAIDPRYPTLVRVAAYTWPPAVRAGRAPGPAAWHGAGRRGGTRSRRAP
jgi:hypothetical protein